MTGEVLVVESEEIVRRFLKRVLSRAGYVVHTATTHREAMDLCRTLSIKVVMADVGWPPTSGHDLARWIAAERPTARVLLMAAWESECEKCPFSSACSVLQKPFHADELLAKVAAALAEALPPAPDQPPS